MLNAFAQGADMLCAEVAFGMGIAVYAVLPCSEEKYIKVLPMPKTRKSCVRTLQSQSG